MPRKWNKYSVYSSTDQPERYTIKNPMAKTGTITKKQEKIRIRKAATKFLSHQSQLQLTEYSSSVSWTVNFSGEALGAIRNADKPRTLRFKTCHLAGSPTDPNLTVPTFNTLAAQEESIKFDEMLPHVDEVTYFVENQNL